jgi:hypothetical protein
VSRHETLSQHATIPQPPADTKAVSPPDESHRRPPRSLKAAINTGVHWRPGPASAWKFRSDGASTPVEPTP